MNRPPCAVDGCFPVVSSLDGTTWFHWIEDAKDRRPQWGRSPVQRYSNRGGLHAARPPDDFDVAAHVKRLRAATVQPVFDR